MKNIKKELKKKIFEDTTKVSGIYKIINKANKKYYVGSSKNIWIRWIGGHRNFLRKNKHKNDYLQNAWNKYGENNFKLVIVKEIINNPSTKQLLKIEQIYLNVAKKEQHKCYNLDFMARGHDWTEYSLRKMRKSIRNHWSIHRHPLLGIPLSDKVKKKMRKNQPDRSGKNNSMYGKRRTKKFREEQSQRTRGENHPKFIKDIFKFKNKNTNEIFIGTRRGLYTTFNLNEASICNLFHGRVKSVHGWILVKK